MIIIRPAYAKRREAQMLSWRYWFAWRPVRVNPNELRWLELVERRLAGGDEYGNFYEYRPKVSRSKPL